MSDCLFCRIASGAIPAKRVHEDDRCIAFRDIQPQAPVHVLVIPREHVASVSALDEGHEELAGHLLRVGAKVAADEGVGDTGYRLVFNTGADAGQSVFHLHLHVLGGRSLAWPPG
ncbi:MAG: Hit-like protein involved in cell-cycle regulation [Pseudomonadota bacterium]|jgi:histidine triad (HIT) family protein